MGNVPFTVEEENLICIYHKHDRRRTIAAISDTLSDSFINSFAAYLLRGRTAILRV